MQNVAPFGARRGVGLQKAARFGGRRGVGLQKAACFEGRRGVGLQKAARLGGRRGVGLLLSPINDRYNAYNQFNGITRQQDEVCRSHKAGSGPRPQ